MVISNSPLTNHRHCSSAISKSNLVAIELLRSNSEQTTGSTYTLVSVSIDSQITDSVILRVILMTNCCGRSRDKAGYLREVFCHHNILVYRDRKTLDGNVISRTLIAKATNDSRSTLSLSLIQLSHYDSYILYSNILCIYDITEQ